MARPPRPRRRRLPRHPGARRVDGANPIDRCSILVNHASTRRRVSRIFVVRTDDGLVLKRAGKDRAGAWQLVSDNPN